MKLWRPVHKILDRWAARVRSRRMPDFVIGDNYLLRWYATPWRRWSHSRSPVARWLSNNLPNAYIHELYRSDDDRALHDHPWPSISIILRGGYSEVMPADPEDPGNGSTIQMNRRAGDVTWRCAHAAHRLEVATPLPAEMIPASTDPRAVTLFITGRRKREWGFWCKWGWRNWREFTAPDDTGKTGRGCD